MIHLYRYGKDSISGANSPLKVTLEKQLLGNI